MGRGGKREISSLSLIFSEPWTALKKTLIISLGRKHQASQQDQRCPLRGSTIWQNPPYGRQSHHVCLEVTQRNMALLVRVQALREARQRGWWQAIGSLRRQKKSFRKSRLGDTGCPGGHPSGAVSGTQTHIQSQGLREQTRKQGLGPKEREGVAKVPKNEALKINIKLGAGRQAELESVLGDCWLHAGLQLVWMAHENQERVCWVLRWAKTLDLQRRRGWSRNSFLDLSLISWWSSEFFCPGLRALLSVQIHPIYNNHN